MELTAAEPPADIPVLALPDPETMAFWGYPTDGGRIVRGPRWLLVPDQIPAGLEDAVREAAEDPATMGVRWVRTPASGRSASEVLARGHHEHAHPDARHGGAHDGDGHGGGHQAHEHGGGDDEHTHMGHHDMMAIVGEPSTDGLVMEDLELQAGPLEVALPGGLVVLAMLDGDVVSHGDVRATLRQDGSASATPLDPLAPVAWTLAAVAARELADEHRKPLPSDWLRVAALELERAASHLSWLLRLMRLIGWRAGQAAALEVVRPLAAANAAVLASIVEDRRDGPTVGPIAPEVVRGVGRLERLVGSRAFATRTSGIGTLTRDDLRRHGVDGPSARASGSEGDLRAGDPVYEELMFATVVLDRGDAGARAAVRIREAGHALGMVERALSRLDSGIAPPARPFVSGSTVALESARGPVVGEMHPGESPRVRAPGEAALRADRKSVV